MSFEPDRFNTIYKGGRKGKEFEITFRQNPISSVAPWAVQINGCGHYFMTLRECLAYCAGRRLIEEYKIPAYVTEVMYEFDRILNE